MRFSQSVESQTSSSTRVNFGAAGLHPNGHDWRLGLAAPRDATALVRTLDPFRQFAATSGDYKTFFSPDFRDNHIFNPKSGRSLLSWSSVTVLAPSGAQADGLSTALFLLDAKSCRRLLQSHPDCSALFFDKAGLEKTVST
jgi:thiamine biosynthesis lipoprotein